MSTRRDEDGDGELLLRGPVVSHGPAGGPLAADREGFVATGLYAAPEGADGGSLRLVKRDVELLHHGGFAIAASELDQLYQSFPGFLDAACFVLPDPIVGDRIFAAIVPRPNEPISLEALHLQGARGRPLQISGQASGGEADPARRVRPLTARADPVVGTRG
jgi:non-ribosomal peptide synthetase component E (peptide arylation enzyme)